MAKQIDEGHMSVLNYLFDNREQFARDHEEFIAVEIPYFPDYSSRGSVRIVDSDADEIELIRRVKSSGVYGILYTTLNKALISRKKHMEERS
ncbi:hypothetical protein HYW75_00035 [Candidatus Pacearchaeota archaeon]|nr:hypothetical protein [Candidatus Pacearchaeota archaeon]